MAEVLELYDRMKRPLGKTIVRGEEIPEGSYHIVVNIMTVNSRGKILLTQRAPQKSSPGCWETTGGSKLCGETERDAAVRELFEETGIRQTADDMIFCGCRRVKKWILSYFLTFAEEPEGGIRLQEGETSAYRWVSPEQFLHIASGGAFNGAEAAVYVSYYAAFFASKPVPKRLRAAGRTLKDVRLPEMLDLFDAAGNPTGGVIVRGSIVPSGTYRMIVSVLTVSKDGKILITRRAAEKSYAGRWEVTGGCIQSGETPVQAAVRELYEETGICTRAGRLIYRGTHRERNIIFQYFLLSDIDRERTVISLQPGETDASDWVTPEEFRALYRADRTITAESLLIYGKYPELLGEP